MKIVTAILGAPFIEKILTHLGSAGPRASSGTSRGQAL
jgi:hypothetical protein